MDLSLERKIFIAFFAVLLILILLGTYSYLNNKKLIETGSWINHTHEVLYQTEQTLAFTVNIETGSRGYVITGDEKFLQPFTKSVSRVHNHLTILKKLTSDNRSQQKRIEELWLLIDKKVKFSEECIRLRRTAGLEPSIQHIKSGEGRKVMDQIRNTMSVMQEEEKFLLLQRVREIEKRIQNFIITLISLIFFVVVILIAVYYFILLNLRVRNKAQLMLRENRELLQSILDNTSSLIFIKDTGGRYVLINRQYEKLFHLNSKDIAGKTDHEIFPAELADCYKKADAQVIRTGRLIEFEEKAYHGQNLHTYLSVKFPLYDHQGRINAVCGIAMDITERKNAEEALLELSRNLDEANKELESFTYSVSHDLRAPLRSIDGYSKILMEDYHEKLDEQGKQTIDTIMRNARKMGRLIDDLLGFSRIGKVHVKKMKISMNEMVEGILYDLKQQQEYTKVHVNVESLEIAPVDANLIRQVWFNLISNAFKYSAKVGRPVVQIGSYSNGNHKVYFVKDNGVGFDMQYSHKLFGVFQRLHRMQDYEGTGVGLAIVKRVVTRHGGEVWAEARINEGSTFYFTIPDE